MATTTTEHPFAGAPAFLEACGLLVWHGTVAELAQAVAPTSSYAGWPECHHALATVVADWMRDRKPTEPRPWCIRHSVVEVRGFNVAVGVGAR